MLCWWSSYSVLRRWRVCSGSLSISLGFSIAFPLASSASKSQIFIAWMDDISKYLILQLFNFHWGSLMVHYLGVPLITSKFFMIAPLVDKNEARIKTWKNNVLSFAGRLQPIKLCFSNIQVFWCSHLILKKKKNKCF